MSSLSGGSGVNLSCSAAPSTPGFSPASILIACSFYES